MSISIRQRWEFVFLNTHPLGPKLSCTKIATNLKCSSTTVKKWVKRYKETGDVEEETKASRKRLTIAQDKMIISTVEKNRDKSMPKIHQLLKKKRVKCSLRTLHNRTQEVGIQSLPPIKKPLLNDSHQKIRLQWAEE